MTTEARRAAVAQELLDGGLAERREDALGDGVAGEPHLFAQERRLAVGDVAVR
jgi:hypothetical protein